MIINHNLGAMRALSALSNNSQALNSALEKLSTGKKINSAADNASGYAISQKMQAQINGLGQASSNAQDGISMIQTASGALNQTTSILQNMRQLATQAANGTTTTSDRKDLQTQFNQLADQINNIANTTQFNTQNLLNGNLAGQTSNLTGSSILQNATVSNPTGLSSGAYTINVAAGSTVVAASLGTVQGSGNETGSISGTYTGGKDISTGNLKFQYDSTSSQWAVSTDGGKTYSTANTTANSAAGVTWNGITLSVTAGSNPTTNGDTFTYNANVSAAKATLSDGAGATNAGTGVSISSSGGAVTLFDGSGHSVIFNPNAYNGPLSSTQTMTFNVTNTPVTFQIGANENQTMQLSVNAMDAQSLGITGNANGSDTSSAAMIGGTGGSNAAYATANDVNNGTNGTNNQAALDITNVSNADKAIQTIDNAIQNVTTQQANLGAIQNRLQSTIKNLGASSQNLTTAKSGITDVNMAKEMSQYTQDNVLQQASVAMLSHANQQPQLVLKLLG